MRFHALLATTLSFLAGASALPPRIRDNGAIAQRPLIAAEQPQVEMPETGVTGGSDRAFAPIKEEMVELWDDEGLVKRYVVGVNQLKCVSFRSATDSRAQAKVKSLHTKPLGSVSDLSRCPSGLMACPITPMTFLESLEDFDADYEWCVSICGEP